MPRYRKKRKTALNDPEKRRRAQEDIIKTFTPEPGGFEDRVREFFDPILKKKKKKRNEP